MILYVNDSWTGRSCVKGTHRCFLFVLRFDQSDLKVNFEIRD